MKTQDKVNAKVAVYDTHNKAVEAIKRLQENEFSLKKVSLLGKADVEEDHLHLKSNTWKHNLPAFIGVGAGTIVGILTGMGVFAIPGFGFLYGAGAVVGAIGGFDYGLVSGGLVSLLSIIGIDEKTSLDYEKHMHDGKYILVIHGTEEEVTTAEKILHTEGTHLELK